VEPYHKAIEKVNRITSKLKGTKARKEEGRGGVSSGGKNAAKVQPLLFWPEKSEK